MVENKIITQQTGGNPYIGGENIIDYQLLLGLNATNSAIRNITPLISGRYRLFFVRPPAFVARYFSVDNSEKSKKSLWMQVKHIMEYCLLSTSDILFTNLSTDAIQGGPSGRSVRIATANEAEPTTTFQITVPEFAGCPVRQVIQDCWKNGIIDPNTGMTHYMGLAAVDQWGNPLVMNGTPASDTTGMSSEGFFINEANHSAEAIFIQTDRTGLNVENAFFLSHMYPTQFQYSQAIGQAGGADANPMNAQITFNVSVYQSVPTTAYADRLLKKFYTASNSINLNPELSHIFNDEFEIDTLGVLGPRAEERALGTNLGNRPVWEYKPATPNIPYNVYNIGDGYPNRQAQASAVFPSGSSASVPNIMYKEYGTTYEEAVK